jgi:hypothetical protein
MTDTFNAKKSSKIQGVKLGASTVTGTAIGAVSGLAAAAFMASTAIVLVPSAIVVGAASIVGGSFGFTVGQGE